MKSRENQDIEKTRLWQDAIEGVKKFDAKERDFFLKKISDHYTRGEKRVAHLYVKLVLSIAGHYQPSEEAKRFCLLLQMIKKI